MGGLPQHTGYRNRPSDDAVTKVVKQSFESTPDSSPTARTTASFHLISNQFKLYSIHQIRLAYQSS